MRIPCLLRSAVEFGNDNPFIVPHSTNIYCL